MTPREQYYAYSDYINGYTSLPCPANAPNTVGDGDTKLVCIPSLSTEQSSTLTWYQELETLILEGREKGLLKNAIVHGSFGDWTFTNYSDLDVTLHIPTDVAQSLDHARHLRSWVTQRFFPFMLSVDPLQHHGPFLLWDSLVESYSEDILPICVYQHSWSVFETSITFKPLPLCHTQNKRRLSLTTCDALMNASSHFFARGHNMFSIKRYLSNLMLIPAFYYTDIDQPTLKAASFESFYQTFGDSSLAIQHASKIRETWPATPWWIRKMAAIPPRFQVRKLPLRLSRRSYFDSTVRVQLCDEVIPAIPALCKAIGDAIQRDE